MAKAKPFKGVKVPDLTNKGPDSTLTRAESVALVSARVKRKPHDDQVSVRNRVSSKLFDDTRDGKIQELRRGIYALDAIARWTEQEYPDLFGDLPRHPRQSAGALGGKATMSLGGYALPASLEDRAREIDRLLTENIALKWDLAAALERMRSLEPDAKKWRDWMTKKKGKRKP